MNSNKQRLIAILTQMAEKNILQHRIKNKHPDEQKK